MEGVDGKEGTKKGVKNGDVWEEWENGIIRIGWEETHGINE